MEILSCMELIFTEVVFLIQLLLSVEQNVIHISAQKHAVFCASWAMYTS